jgi:hypothetical protein
MPCKTNNNDPDFGLEVRDEVIKKLQAQRKANKPGVSLEEVANKFNITLKGDK